MRPAMTAAVLAALLGRLACGSIESRLSAGAPFACRSDIEAVVERSLLTNGMRVETMLASIRRGLGS